MITPQKPVILIVEDDLSSQQYYEVVLEDEYNLDIVPMAKDARQALEAKMYGVIIIDISLPGEEDGIELIGHIRNELGLNSPILVITAHAFPENRFEAMQAGASEFFSKPILAKTLQECLNKYLKTEPGNK